MVLVHDLSFIERREATTKAFLLVAFGFLAFAAAVTTVVAARLSWRGWSNELRRLLKGEAPRAEFVPFLRDVRELVDRLASEREVDGLGGLWTPQRLKNTLSRHLHGERVVIVANREPYIHQRLADGSVTVAHPASGLVTALEPVMRACSGVWVAHGSGSGDRDVADAQGHVRVPPGFGCDTALYVGDDDTDEDVFALDQPGRLLTIRVGRKLDSLAGYFLRNQAEIDVLLRVLHRLGAKRRTTARVRTPR